MNDAIVHCLASHFPTLRPEALHILASGLTDAQILTPLMDSATLDRRIRMVVDQTVAHIASHRDSHPRAQTAGTAAIQVAGHVVDSTLTTLILQAINPPDTPWFQIPPLPAPLDTDPRFPALSPEQAALQLFASMPLDTVPAVSIRRAPESLLPYRVPTFIGRTQLLTAIARHLREPHTPTILSAITTGMMGVGKTSLALEFGHRYGQYFAGGVFWINCTLPMAIPLELANLGVRMNLFREIIDLESAVAQVLQAWRHPIPRLLIFDNCEDPAVLERYVPSHGGSRVVVTSRRTTWGAYPTIAVGILPREDSILLLQQLASHLSSADADRVAAVVGDLPLALHLAGSYMGMFQETADQYLMALDVTHRSFHGVGVDMPAIEMPTRTDINLLTIIRHATRAITSESLPDVLARDMLDIVCHLSPGDPLPFPFLTRCLSPTFQNSTSATARRRLQALGLLQEHDANHVSLHRLIHQALTPTYATPPAAVRVERQINATIVEILDAGFPFSLPTIVPHAEWVVTKALGRADEHAATVTSHLAGLYAHQARFEQAQSLHEQALAIRYTVLDDHHPDIAISLNSVAGVYLNRDQFDTAESSYHQALTIFKQHGGERHPDVAMVLNNLGHLYLHRGRYTEAEACLQESLTITEGHYSADHIHTATVLHNVAGVYGEQGRFSDAEALYRRVLTITKGTVGEEHPITAKTLNNLAQLYQTQGQFAEAESLYTETLAIIDQHLHEDHPYRTTVLINFASLYDEQGNYALAESLYQEAFLIRQRIFGNTHTATIKSLSSLATFYAGHNRWDAAEPLITQLVEGIDLQRQILGERHPDLASNLGCLAALYSHQGHHDEAESTYIEALTIEQGLFGSHHPTVANTAYNLGLVYVKQGRADTALLLVTRALQILRATFGLDHPKTQRVMEAWEPIAHRVTLALRMHAVLAGDTSVLGVLNGYLDTCRSSNTPHPFVEIWSKLLNGERNIGQLLAQAPTIDDLGFQSLMILHALQSDPQRVPQLKEALRNERQQQLDPNFTEILTAFIGANDWATARRLVERHRSVLLSDLAEEFLNEGIVETKQDHESRVYRHCVQYRDLLVACREQGIQAAFAPLEEEDRLRVAIQAMQSCPDFSALRFAVEEHQAILLSDAAIMALNRTIARAQTDHHIQAIPSLIGYRNLLQACRDRGISEAFMIFLNYPAIRTAIEALIALGDGASIRAFIEDHADLLVSDAAVMFLEQSIEIATATHTTPSVRLAHCRTVLQRCQTHGIAATFARL